MQLRRPARPRTRTRAERRRRSARDRRRPLRRTQRGVKPGGTLARFRVPFCFLRFTARPLLLPSHASVRQPSQPSPAVSRRVAARSEPVSESTPIRARRRSSTATMPLRTGDTVGQVVSAISVRLKKTLDEWAPLNAEWNANRQAIERDAREELARLDCDWAAICQLCRLSLRPATDAAREGARGFQDRLQRLGSHQRHDHFGLYVGYLRNLDQRVSNALLHSLSIPTYQPGIDLPVCRAHDHARRAGIKPAIPD